MKFIRLIFISLALLIAVPAMAADDMPKYTGEKVSLDFQDAPVRNILQLIADVSGRNLVIGEGVEGLITLKLRNVPWDQALDIVLDMHALGKVEEGNIIRVNTLANMARKRDEEGRAKATKVRAEDLITRVVPVNYNIAKDLLKTLAGQASFLSDRGQLSADTRTNSLIVRDVESSIDRMVELVRELDSPTRQVTIEARIVQVRPSFNRNLGIQWGGGYTAYNNSNTLRVQGINPGSATQPGLGVFAPDFAVNLPAAEAVSGVGVSFGRLLGSPVSLDLRLSAGEKQGLTKIVSTPKVTVLDNQTAKIEQGESVPFQTVSQDGTQTTFHDANLALEVTPHITGDGRVSMEIRISKNALGERTFAAGPSILKREANTHVLLNDGETTVIGGIFERTQVDSSQRVPFLSKLPILGYLFQNKSKEDKTEELLVFITPRIVK